LRGRCWKRRQKRSDVVVELKASFDEASNIAGRAALKMRVCRCFTGWSAEDTREAALVCAKIWTEQSGDMRIWNGKLQSIDGAYYTTSVC